MPVEEVTPRREERRSRRRTSNSMINVFGGYKSRRRRNGKRNRTLAGQMRAVFTQAGEDELLNRERDTLQVGLTVFQLAMVNSIIVWQEFP